MFQAKSRWSARGSFPNSCSRQRSTTSGRSFSGEPARVLLLGASGAGRLRMATKLDGPRARETWAFSIGGLAEVFSFAWSFSGLHQPGQGKDSAYGIGKPMTDSGPIPGRRYVEYNYPGAGGAPVSRNQKMKGTT